MKYSTAILFALVATLAAVALQSVSVDAAHLPASADAAKTSRRLPGLKAKAAQVGRHYDTDAEYEANAILINLLAKAAKLGIHFSTDQQYLDNAKLINIRFQGDAIRKTKPRKTDDPNKTKKRDGLSDQELITRKEADRLREKYPEFEDMKDDQEVIDAVKNLEGLTDQKSTLNKKAEMLRKRYPHLQNLEKDQDVVDEARKLKMPKREPNVRKRAPRNTQF